VAVAALLAGVQPHRRGLIQGKGPALRRAKARVLEALFEATQEALGALSAEDARGYFEHCGYAMLQAHSI
jgi:hypothetical protein